MNTTTVQIFITQQANGTSTSGAPPASDWILANGFWNDSGFWRDDQNWID